MRFLTDENIGLGVVSFLRAAGHNVTSAIEEFPGTPDLYLLQKAVRENRVLITSDTDFGELIYLRKLPHKGVILLRITRETNPEKIKVLANLLKAYQKELKGRFIVVTETQVRIRPPRKTTSSSTLPNLPKP